MISTIGDRLGNPAGVWPWVEANQGLLSVLALAAAFGIAAWEIRQSVRRDQRALAAYIDWIVHCADWSIELSDDAMRYLQTDGKDGMGVSPAVWIMLTRNALSTLEEIQPMRPTHPELTHFVNRLIRCMTISIELDLPAQDTYRKLDDFKTYVVIHRDHVLRFRPNTIADHLRKLLGKRPPMEASVSRPANFR